MNNINLYKTNGEHLTYQDGRRVPKSTVKNRLNNKLGGIVAGYLYLHDIALESPSQGTL